MSVRKSLALAIAVAGIGGASQSVPVLAQSANWSGPYVGIGGGGGWGQQSQSGGILNLPNPGSGSTITSIITTDGHYDLSGGLVGGSIGYNFQSGRTVYGIEADASWADISGSGTCDFGGVAPHSCGGDIAGLETVRGRWGYDVGPLVPSLGDVLVFASGGLAVGQIHAWDSLFGTSGDKTAAGWTVGGGLEAMLGTNWSVKLEYLYVDLGDPAVFSAIPPIPEHVSTTADVVRVGLDYHFNAFAPVAPAPIVRK
jgi:outer membrane immunogenic protein